MNPTFFLATAMSLTTAAGATLSVRILDERGAATPARVYLTDAAGAPRSPAGALVYDKTRGVSESHFVPRSGSFDIDLPAGAWRIVIERGKEYRSITDDINMPSAGRVERSYRLERWVRMNDRGWYSGDMHLHRATDGRRGSQRRHPHHELAPGAPGDQPGPGPAGLPGS
jgi:hypothetical protein